MTSHLTKARGYHASNQLKDCSVGDEEGDVSSFPSARMPAPDARTVELATSVDAADGVVQGARGRDVIAFRFADRLLRPEKLGCWEPQWAGQRRRTAPAGRPAFQHAQQLQRQRMPFVDLPRISHFILRCACPFILRPPPPRHQQ